MEALVTYLAGIWNWTNQFDKQAYAQTEIKITQTDNSISFATT